MKTFRGFPLKSNVGIGLQNHFDRKKTHAPTQFSKWGGFRDKDWDVLDKEFYSNHGKHQKEAAYQNENEKEDRIILSKKSTKISAKVAPLKVNEESKKIKNDFSARAKRNNSMWTCPPTPKETMSSSKMSSIKEVKKQKSIKNKFQIATCLINLTLIIHT